jgi:cell division protein FtsZ
VKVIGVGGAGCKALNAMLAAGLSGVDFIAVDSDSRILMESKAAIQVRIGAEERRGLDGHADPSKGASAPFFRNPSPALNRSRVGLDRSQVAAPGSGRGHGQAA